MTYHSSGHIIEPETSLSLLDGAKKGHTESWDRIVRLYGPIIYSWARRSHRQPADAADIVQEVLTDVSKGLVRFSTVGQGTTFRGWLWTIARRRLADQARDWGKMVERSLSPDIDRVACDFENLAIDPPTAISDDRHSLLMAAIAGLHRQFNTQTIDAFRLVVMENQDPDQVATTLGISRWSVYKAKSRVLQRLRRDLDGLID